MSRPRSDVDPGIWLTWSMENIWQPVTKYVFFCWQFVTVFSYCLGFWVYIFKLSLEMKIDLVNGLTWAPRTRLQTISRPIFTKRRCTRNYLVFQNGAYVCSWTLLYWCCAVGFSEVCANCMFRHDLECHRFVQKQMKKKWVPSYWNACGYCRPLWSPAVG